VPKIRVSRRPDGVGLSIIVFNIIIIFRLIDFYTPPLVQRYTGACIRRKHKFALRNGTPGPGHHPATINIAYYYYRITAADG
jgi:hypothetical protein